MLQALQSLSVRCSKGQRCNSFGKSHDLGAPDGPVTSEPSSALAWVNTRRSGPDSLHRSTAGERQLQRERAFARAVQFCARSATSGATPSHLLSEH